MKYYDSIEVEQLKQLIAKKEAYLQKVNNKFAYQQLQKEILFLKNDILPIVLHNTNVVHSEIAKVAVLAFDTGLSYKVNGVVTYFPIDENYADNPIIGIYNSSQLLGHKTPGAMEVRLVIDNMDGNEAKPRIHNLQLNELIYGDK